MAGVGRKSIDTSLFDRIAPGMTESDVITTLGCECGDYTRSKKSAVSYLLVSFNPDNYRTGYSMEWVGDEAAIMVIFDDHGRVTRVLHGIVDAPKSWLQKLTDACKAILGL